MTGDYVARRLDALARRATWVARGMAVVLAIVAIGTVARSWTIAGAAFWLMIPIDVFSRRGARQLVRARIILTKMHERRLARARLRFAVLVAQEAAFEESHARFDEILRSIAKQLDEPRFAGLRMPTRVPRKDLS